MIEPKPKVPKTSDKIIFGAKPIKDFLSIGQRTLNELIKLGAPIKKYGNKMCTNKEELEMFITKLLLE